MTYTRRRRHARFGHLPQLAFMSMLTIGVGVACSNGSPEASPDAFCATARQNPELITNPPLETPDQIDQSIEFYRLMGQLAPIEIAPEWNQLLEAMETANELVPDNPESEQLVAQTAFASELAAVRVKEWMSERCGIDLPITTIVSHDGSVSSLPTGGVAPTVSGPAASVPNSDPGNTPDTSPVSSGPAATTTETTATP